MARSNLADTLKELAETGALSDVRWREALDAMFDDELPAAQVAALLYGLRLVGETPTQLAEAARALRARCATVPIPRGTPLVDTCGTGGDGAGSFNISTVAALVVAACGVRVAKHGNRAVSSRSGSADLLEALGVRLELSPRGVAECIENVGMGFLYAPAFHSATRHVGPARRALAVPTLFNLVGPLSNPAGATHQIIGVYAASRLGIVAEALALLGVERAWVVHGEGGLDEISPAGRTRVVGVGPKGTHEFELHPRDFGAEPTPLEALCGGDAELNAGIARRLLSGEKVPVRTAVLLNAAAALCVVETQTDALDEKGLRSAYQRASEALDSGAAQRLLASLREQSQRSETVSDAEMKRAT